MEKVSEIGIIFIVIQVITHVSVCDKYEKALLAHLFNKSREDAHNPMERPVPDNKKPLEVRLRFDLAQIMDVDERNQILKTSIWMDMRWYDYHFVWNPELFGNITSINMSPDRIWTPDIIMYNSASEQFDQPHFTNVIIYNNGHIYSQPPRIYSSTCTIDITYFPFDRQNCFLKFGSWTFDGNGIDLKVQCPTKESFMNRNETATCTESGEAGLNSYVKHGEWILISGNVKRYVKRYDCCDVDFYDIKLHITIHRRSLYYIFNLILPCALISIISLLVFSLPPDAGEKISLGVTILLSLTMFLLLVANSLPQTSIAIPLISIYFSIIMIICSTSLICTVCVLNYHHRSSDAHQVPKFIAIVINKWLAKCLFMTPPGIPDGFHNHLKPFHNERNQFSFRNIDSSSSSNQADLVNKPVELQLLEDPHKRFCNKSGQTRDIRENGVSIESVDNSGASSRVSSLDSILRELQCVTSKINDLETANIIGQQWKFAARVIDRVCLIFFTVFTLICSLAALLSAKNDHDGLIPAEDRII